jgi:hypothetical protein
MVQTWICGGGHVLLQLSIFLCLMEDIMPKPRKYGVTRRSLIKQAYGVGITSLGVGILAIAFGANAEVPEGLHQNQPTVLSENLTLYTPSFFENTAKVVTPSVTLPQGKIVVHLGQPRGSAGFVSRDLLDAANNFAVSATAVKFPYPLDSATQVNATDNQLIRLQDGSLLAAKNGYIWSDLSPRPTWFDTTTVSFGSGRARNAIYFFRSTDGGVSWSLLSYIDSAVVEGGKYGWPQTGNTGTLGVGGFDRTELYQDPWTGDIFVSGHGDGGPYTLNGTTTDNHAGVIFRSQDNGLTWNTFHVFNDAPNQSKGAAPYTMTSTPDHPLIVFHIENSKPTLYFVENGVMSGARTVVASDGGGFTELRRRRGCGRRRWFTAMHRAHW